MSSVRLLQWFCNRGCHADRRCRLSGAGPYETAQIVAAGRQIVVRMVRRLLVLLAGMLGVLAVFAGPAHAYISYNHCEPVRR